MELISKEKCQQQKLSTSFLSQLSYLRQQLHKIPEIGLQQHKTSAFVREYLNHIQNVYLEPALQRLPTAIIARINHQSQNYKNQGQGSSGGQGKNEKQVFLFRAELDALEWTEESGELFSSTNGLHHACGHDAHMACLMVACKILAGKVSELRKLNRQIIFCFQPGQEGKGGANKLMEQHSQLLNKVKHCFALHSGNHREAGVVLASPGIVLANSNRFTITIKGQGCHTMIPHQAIDANLIGCGLVSQLYALKGIKIGPLQQGTLSVVRVQGGQSVSMIAENFKIIGTLRMVTLQSQKKMANAIQTLSREYCKAFGAVSQFQLSKSNYRAVQNNHEATQLVRSVLNKVIQEKNNIQTQQLSFAGEDFCEFSQRIPSCYFVMGSAIKGSFNENGESIYPLHSKRHKLDQNFMELGTKIWIELALGNQNHNNQQNNK